VQCTVAVTTLAARGALTRVETPRPLRQFLGLMPSEYSRGERRLQRAITTAGHTHARQALVAGAWAYQEPAKGSRHLHPRLEPHPNAIQDISGNTPVRLCTRSRRLMARGQHANHVVVALARELVGCLWAIAKHVAVTPSAHTTRGQFTCPLQTGCQGHRQRRSPGGDATLDGVKRPIGILAPRVRQAADARTSGGTQSTDISRINRRL
jgi:hypothetical protein